MTDVCLSVRASHHQPRRWAGTCQSLPLAESFVVGDLGRRWRRHCDLVCFRPTAGLFSWRWLFLPHKLQILVVAHTKPPRQLLLWGKGHLATLGPSSC